MKNVIDPLSMIDKQVMRELRPMGQIIRIPELEEVNIVEVSLMDPAVPTQIKYKTMTRQEYGDMIKEDILKRILK